MRYGRRGNDVGLTSALIRLIHCVTIEDVKKTNRMLSPHSAGTVELGLKMLTQNVYDTDGTDGF